MTPPSSTRVWFITGTSSGLGKALVALLLSKGDSVAATSRNPACHADLATKYPTTLLSLALDVAKPEEVSKTMADVYAHFGRIDVVVNNASFVVYGEIESIPLEDARAQVDMFWGAAYVLRETARIFREQGTGGTVFSISSIGGLRAQPTIAFYNAAKFALEGLTQSFLAEMDPSWNIKGAIIEPGGFDSEWRLGKAVPIHPAYDTATNSCKAMRAMHEQVFTNLGTSESMAEALYKLSKEPELPLRVQLGSEALAIAQYQMKKTLEDSEKWAAFSRSTDKPEVDSIAYVEGIVKYLP
ncbi:NAD(P)-binding protein [Cylindrobasidium torrendii FP15055 ss-10]|uniref:NAD(P)-binding protein n=1 Tax=Cylindrobasidium torrendii FP15055 ss-10 TaxID=1314674 RepID=A0A0D7BNA2_9AGAR|nr:NAD(P)-binding protein [Cylindrobasidium torrendii FP15055 ss-10]